MTRALTKYHNTVFILPPERGERGGGGERGRGCCHGIQCKVGLKVLWYGNVMRYNVNLSDQYGVIL